MSASGHQESLITEATHDTEGIGKGMDDFQKEGKNDEALSLHATNSMHKK